MVTFKFKWKRVLAIAGLTLHNFFFQSHDGSIKSAKVIGSLRAPRGQVHGKILLLWEAHPGSIHRDRLVTAFI